MRSTHHVTNALHHPPTTTPPPLASTVCNKYVYCFYINFVKQTTTKTQRKVRGNQNHFLYIHIFINLHSTQYIYLYVYPPPYIVYWTVCMHFPLYIYVTPTALDWPSSKICRQFIYSLKVSFFLLCFFFLFFFFLFIFVSFFFEKFYKSEFFNFIFALATPRCVSSTYGGQGQLVSPVLTAMPSSTTSSSITATDFVFIMKMPRYMEVCLPLPLSISFSLPHKLTFARRWQCDCESSAYTHMSYKRVYYSDRLIWRVHSFQGYLPCFMVSLRAHILYIDL